MHRSLALSAALALLLVSSAFADVPVDDPPPRRPVAAPAGPKAVPLTVKMSDEVTRIEIPRKFLAVGAARPSSERQGSLGLPGVRTIAAGVALSLGAVALIFWRGRSRAVKAAAAAALIGAGVFGLSAAAYADLRVPDPPEDLRIQVVVVERGDAVVLHLSGGALDAAFNAQAGGGGFGGVGSAPPE